MSRKTFISRRQLLLLAAACSFAALVTGGFALRPKSAIKRENCERLMPGMTLREAEEVLGGPARDETTGIVMAELTEEDKALAKSEGSDVVEWAMRKAIFQRLDGQAERSELPTYLVHWQTDNAIVSLRFDGDSRMFEKKFLAVRRKYDTPWARLRSWLKI